VEAEDALQIQHNLLELWLHRVLGRVSFSSSSKRSCRMPTCRMPS
jgi:hypothetical protein